MNGCSSHSCKFCAPASRGTAANRSSHAYRTSGTRGGTATGGGGSTAGSKVTSTMARSRMRLMPRKPPGGVGAGRPMRVRRMESGVDGRASADPASCSLLRGEATLLRGCSGFGDGGALAPLRWGLWSGRRAHAPCEQDALDERLVVKGHGRALRGRDQVVLPLDHVQKGEKHSLLRPPPGRRARVGQPDGRPHNVRRDGLAQRQRRRADIHIQAGAPAGELDLCEADTDVLQDIAAGPGQQLEEELLKLGIGAASGKCDGQGCRVKPLAGNLEQRQILATACVVHVREPAIQHAVGVVQCGHQGREPAAGTNCLHRRLHAGADGGNKDLEVLSRNQGRGQLAQPRAEDAEHARG
eukprot:m.71717 g.71717  ORF g.71717 m.71717 type:complete len:355 (+) comp7645_c0_seq3:1450-2514(+)